MDSSVQSSPVPSHSCSWPKPHVLAVKVAVTFLPSLVQEMSWQLLHPSQRQWELLTALCWAIPWDWGELTEWLPLSKEDMQTLDGAPEYLGMLSAK